MFIAYIADVLLIFILIGGFSIANEEDGQIKEFKVDESGNLTLPCTGEESLGEGVNEDEEGEEVVTVMRERVYWIHEGKTIDSTVLENNSLFLEHMKREDAGIYKCASTDTDEILSQMKVIVRTPPPRLVNVSVHASTILALLRWDVADTGGYPITHFTAQYRLKHGSLDEPPDEWHRVIPGRISPAASQIDVYKLEPNSTYIFEVWASNQLGEGEVVQVEGTTHHDSEEIGSMQIAVKKPKLDDSSRSVEATIVSISEDEQGNYTDTSVTMPPQRNFPLYPCESEETRKLTTEELQRLVLLRQLQTAKVQEEYYKKKIERLESQAFNKNRSFEHKQPNVFEDGNRSYAALF